MHKLFWYVDQNYTKKTNHSKKIIIENVKKNNT